ncbi:MAG: COX15/CtaA family protein [Saprospiraceae bacterium]|nr:COX15/CtaA family protein [Saprospiraceae bacterium]
MPMLSLVFVLLLVQIFLGGVMSGMKAAVVFPTWPDMNGVYFPKLIFDSSQWNVENFNNYDKTPFMPALIHFLHRNTAYLLFILGNVLSYRLVKFGNMYNIIGLKKVGYLVSIMLLLQVVIGIITVISSKGSIPVFWGVLHQAGALVLLTILVFTIFIIRIKK